MKNLLILPGALGAKSQFEDLEKHLGNHFNVWFLNYEGHGGQSTEQTFSIALFAENTQNFIHENQLENCIVFGYSMGGYIALYLERNNPGTFQKILTLGTKFDWNVFQSEKEASFLNPDQLETDFPAFANYLIQLHGDTNWKNVTRKTADMMLKMGINPPLSKADYSEIHLPVTLIRGAKDKMVSEEETIAVYQTLNQAKYIEVENWQHPIDRIELESLAKQLLKLT